jgi:hypothetical protein
VVIKVTKQNKTWKTKLKLTIALTNTSVSILAREKRR